MPLKKSSSPPISTSTTAITTAATTAIAYLAGLDWQLTQIDWSLAINWIIGLSSIGGVTGYITSDRKSADSDTFSITNDSLPLGLRNNNPGNIRPDSRWDWQGQVGTNKGFVVFDSDLMGLRAMARNLRNQQRIHNLDTIESILKKYAPDNENDTQAYISFVSKQTGILPHIPLDLEDDGVVTSLMVPMIRMENGQQPYSTEKIMEAVKLA